MPAAYIPLLFFASLVLSFPIITLTVFKFIPPSSRGGPANFQHYERGILPENSARGRHSGRFYIIVMVFVIFEVGTIFLFPWAILFRGWLAQHHAALALLSMFVFLGVFLVGYVWLYKKGALDLA
jgi:NADH:ubiquinone oxidoreductase subunit 3 (subunit A)